MGKVLHIAGREIRLIPLDAAAVDWLAHIKLRGALPNTQRAYCADLASAFGFFNEERASIVALITDRLIDRWLAQLSRGGMSPRTQARKLSALKAFLRFAKRERWIDHDPAQDLQVRFRPRRVIAPEMDQLMRMLDAIPSGKRATAMDLRDYALLRLVLDTGIRAGEVVALDTPHWQPAPLYTVDLKRMEVRVLGKGDCEGVVPFNEGTARALLRWLEVRPALPTESALFTSHRQRRITRQAVHYMLRRRGHAVGLERLHLHLLRHRRIGDITERLGIKVAQGIARHSDPSTTLSVYGAHAMNVVHRTVRELADLDNLKDSA